jgi:hypothetical protein
LINERTKKYDREFLKENYELKIGLNSENILEILASILAVALNYLRLADGTIPWFSDARLDA